MKIVVAAIFTLVLAHICVAQTSKGNHSKAGAPTGKLVPPRSSGGEKPQKGRPCVFDFERGDLPDCILDCGKGERCISPKYLGQLNFDAHGLAAVLVREESWMYVNRKGRVIISGVPVMDNGADEFHDGLVRMVKHNQYGFANRKGQVVVPAIFDGAGNFENGIAEVCMGCRSECVSDCEIHALVGGAWFQINTSGEVVKRGRRE